MFNSPPCKPIPLLTIDKLIISCKIQRINTIIATLLKRMDISRLKVTEFESNTDNIEIDVIKKKSLC